MRALRFVYIIIEKVSQAHVQNAPFEWFWSTPWRGDMYAKAVDRDLLIAYNIR